MPPNFPIAMHILLSVTVSMADEIIGIFKLTFFDNSVAVFTSEGKTSEKFGAKVTSSNVRASLIISMSLYK